MIKDYELRRSNYVYFSPNGKGFVHQVKETRVKDIVCNNLDDPDQRLVLYYDSGWLQPIQLTEDWLERLGLIDRYHTGTYSWVNCSKMRVWDSYTEITKRGGLFYYLSDYPPIMYVHQLQNLFIDLTGERLLLR